MILRSLCLAAVLVLALAAPASAHNVTAGADLRIAQTIAGAEITVVIKGTSRVPGPLRIGVIAYQPVSGLPVGLEVRSVEDGRTVTGTAQAAAEPAYTQLRVERTGPHELKLSAGGEVAVVPFRVLVERGSMGDFLIYGGLFMAAMLLVGGLLTGATARTGRAMALAAGAAAGVTVAAMVIVFEPGLPPPAPDGAAPTTATPAAGGRPYAQARVETAPARPGAGEEFTLRLDLMDGSTGRPVDDLAVHHEALAHVVVTSEDGRYFRHVHPLRTAPGHLEVKLSTDRPGRYLVHAELEREDSGGQLVTADFTVGGEARASAEPDASAEAGAAEDRGAAEDTSAAEDGGAAATPRLQPVAPVAGRPATIELDTPAGVRPWLGMTGHLIVRSQDGAFLGHVHEMGTPGSRLRFTFSFPTSGRYLAWIQYATGDRIVTEPFTVDVTAAEVRR
ncbi:hypothetical protein [Nonomuraea gerenzanensis]|uniref:Putative secreted protein n=1 Tax=Nonomuraea gerenzanensis TaxID=93944 RepID=A0A1M4E8G5_9ACTN|nr:hypothetical protein [Nonomuraea gerenzanensis]UBU17408.1 hypothetical protein LCN96_20995 [Nonomuraea gerenzanensis]SBO95161.1 Putative secreted protein [Nonomuraea gerenzanensis]